MAGSIIVVVLKNLSLRRRQWFVTFCELFLAFILTGLSMLFNADPGCGSQVSALPLPIPALQISFPCDESGFLTYTPVDPTVEQTMKDVVSNLCPSQNKIRLVPVPNEQDLNATIAATKEKFRGSIVFTNGFTNSEIQYKIRLDPIGKVPCPPYEKGGPNYEYFVLLQMALNTVLMKNINISPNITVEPFQGQVPSTPQAPTSAPNQTVPRTATIGQCIFAFCIGMIFMVPSITRNVVGEKQSGIKELLRLSGVPLYAQYIGWAIHVFVPIIISSLLVLYLFAVPMQPLAVFYSPPQTVVFLNSNIILGWLILLLYGFASAGLVFFTCSILQSPTISSAVNILMWLITLTVGMIGTLHGSIYPVWMKILLSLFPNCAIAFIFQQVSVLECVGTQGLNFKTAWDTPGSVDTETGWFILMLLVDLVVYTITAIILDLSIPTEYGVSICLTCNEGKEKAGPPYPPQNLVAPTSRNSDVSAENVPSGQGLGLGENTESNMPSSFEPEPEGAVVAVEIQNLVKQFGTKVSVNNISLRMFQGDIFALLGHNGAGKTTTISMLTGFTKPTSGTAIINGYDIRYQLSQARKTMGFCPQHNMLFERLTVMQQLVLFGMIRGLSCKQAKEEARNLMGRMSLAEKANVEARKLSGGQKRKLNLGMALIGDTRFVIMDEPTSGMDPQARREIWDLLLELRGQRTMLLTTHFMEEADVLGDRLAVMANGELQCCGTAAFLKKHYGAGYTLKFTFEPQPESEDDPVRPEAQHLLAIVQKHVPNASSKHLSRLEIRPDSECFVLPGDTATTKTLQQMFAELTAAKAKPVTAYKTISLQVTTMDEVFMRVGQLAHGAVEEDDDDDASEIFERSPKVESNKWIVQFLALCIKKLLYSLDKWTIIIVQMTVPLLLLLCAVFTIYYAGKPAVTNSVYLLCDPSTSPPPGPSPEPNVCETMFDINLYPSAVTLYSREPSTTQLDKGIMASIGASAVASNNLYQDLQDAKGRIYATEFSSKYIVAFQLDFKLQSAPSIRAFYNEHVYDSYPLAISMATNLALVGTSRFIKVTNEPLMGPIQGVQRTSMERSLLNYKPVNSKTNQREPRNIMLVSFIIPFAFFSLLSIGAMFNCSPIVSAPIEERLCQVKQLQLMTGVSPILYWWSTFLWDFFIYLVFLVLTVVFLVMGDFALGHQILTPLGGLEATVTVLLIYGPVAIIYNYFITLRSGSVSGGVILTILSHCLSGIVMSFLYNTIIEGIIPVVQQAFDTTDIILMIILVVVEILGHLTPTYLLAKCLFKIASTAIFNDMCYPESRPYFQWSQKHSSLDSYVFDADGDGKLMLFLAIFGVIVTILFLMIELRFFSIFTKCGRKPETDAGVTDEDVIAESMRVSMLVTSGLVDRDCLVVHQLEKSYASFAAVRKLSFGVNYGECFGLLGVNGAGKTTTFRMITGDETPTSGKLYGFGTSIGRNRNRYLSHIGYCPQFDALLNRFTGLQMLCLFAGLRGVPFKQLHSLSWLWLQRMGLEDSAKARCGRYSGGMKRRLSTAMAMIGDPDLILLDEPTSGVDPVSRRNFWNIVDNCRASGQSIILTSHSLDECEALCDCLGIMVNGQFQCFGTADSLRSKFAQGYALIVKLKPDLKYGTPEVDERIEKFENKIIEQFQPCEIKDKHQNLLQFHLQNSEMGWDMIFGTMESLKEEFNQLIEDYSVNESSLEEVFLSFARAQYGERKVKVGCCKRIFCRS